MADENTPHNAAAPEILAALKGLEADLKAARAELANIQRQVGVTAGRPTSAIASGSAEGAAAAESRLTDAERLAKLEQEHSAALTEQDYKARSLAAMEARRAEIAAQSRTYEQEALKLRAQEVIAESNVTNALEQQIRIRQRMNALIAEATALPAGQRAEFLGNAMAAPYKYGGFGGQNAQVGPSPFNSRDVSQATSGAFGADSATRIEQTRSRVAQLAITEGEYAAATRTSSAMSGEFLSRLASGQATLSEFGSNLAGTAGKFAGWTAAAAGVGGLIKVVSELSHGAQDSASGVNQLSRSVDNVNTETAQQGFRNVSRELNVSIKDVADAQFQMSRTFNTQKDSLTAGRVALLAYKLDNVSLADSVKALTAVHNQFGVTASELPGIFDQLDEGQRKFNARVGESLPALTRSVAAVKDAGGSLQGLLPIIEYGVRVSGQTGPVVGNALARSAANFVPKNAADLKALGLDPTQGYTDLLTEAITKAEHMTGEQRRQVARALGGPQLGSRVFEPLLGDAKQFAEIQKGIDPSASSGAAKGELADKLKQTDEQLHQITNSLQRLGSSLAESGAFAGLGAALKTLNFLLDDVNKLVSYFNLLPASIRPFVVGLIEARTILAVLQRTRLGAGLADATGVGFLGPNAEQRAVKQQVSGLQVSAGAYESEAAAKAAQARATEQSALIQQRVAEEQRANGLYAEANASEAEALKLQRDSAVMEEQAVALRRAALEERAQILALQRGEVAVDEEILAMNQRQIAQRSAANALGSAGVAAAGVGEAETAVVGAGAAEAGVVAESRAAALRRGATEIAGAGKNFGSKLLSFGDGLGLMSKALGSFIVGEIFFDHLKRDVEAIDKQTASLTQGNKNVQGLIANRQASKAASNNGIPGVARVFDVAVHDLPGAALSAVTGGFINPQNFRPFGDSLQTTQQNAAKAQQKLDDSVLKARRDTQGNSFEQVGRSYEELLAENQKNVDAFAAHHITQSEFNKRYQQILRSMSASIDVLTGDGKGLSAAQAAARAQMLQGIQKAGPTKADPFAQFDKASLAENVDFLDTINQREKVSGTKGADFTAITRGIAFVAGQGAGTQDKKTLQQIAAAYTALDNFIQQQADEFKVILDEVKRTGDNIPASAITPAVALTQYNLQTSRTDSAYTDYIRKLKGEHAQIPKRVNELSAGLTKDVAQLRDLEQQRQSGKYDVPGLGSFTPFGTIQSDGIGAGSPVTNLDAQITALKKKIADDKKKVKAGTDALNKRDQKILDQLAQAQEEQFQIDTQAIDLRSQYAQTTASDKSDAIAEKLKADAEQVKLALAYHGPDKWAKVMQALTTQNQDIAAQAQQHLQDVQLQGDLSTSQIRGTGTGADRARLESQLSTARSVLAAAKAERNNPGKHDDIINAEIKVNDLLNQIDQSVQQDAANAHALAEALYNSEIAIRIAKAGDDAVKRDQITLQGDQHNLASLKRGDFKTQQEYITARNNALAKVITDRHQITTDTANKDLQNAEFEHNINKITDQQYIQKLRDILKLKGLSTQMRQNLLLEIYRQEHQNDGSLELNTGNIRMPSTYEIVRNLRQNAGRTGAMAKMGQGTLLNQTNHNTFNFNIAGGDPKKVVAAVAAALDNATGGSAIGNLRAAGAL